MPSSSLVDKYTKGEIPMYFLRDMAIVPDAAYVTNLWLNSHSMVDYSRFKNDDVDKLIDLQLKNIDAIAQSAHVAGEGAKTLAAKQREIIEAAFKQTSDMVREFHPTGDPQEILAKQKDYAKKAFELTVQNTRDLADLTKKTTSDATSIVQERLRSSLGELRDSVTRTRGGS